MDGYEVRTLTYTKNVQECTIQVLSLGCLRFSVFVDFTSIWRRCTLCDYSITPIWRRFYCVTLSFIWLISATLRFIFHHQCLRVGVASDRAMLETHSVISVSKDDIFSMDSRYGNRNSWLSNFPSKTQMAKFGHHQRRSRSSRTCTRC